MFGFWRERKRAKVLARSPVPDELWQRIVRMPLLIGLNADELARLREHVSWFVHEKAITSVDGLELNDDARVMLAVQAVLPILNLGFDAYDDWHELVVYPGGFVSRARHVDPIGVVHEFDEHLAGQARGDGPVLLSLADANHSPWLDGWNVVIHEVAHKLDMRGPGGANGCPPLNADMSADAWQRDFSRAFNQLRRIADAGGYSPIDLYAAENPAECFAVFSEYFFETPHAIAEHYPAIYTQLKAFYRQDPLARLPLMRYRPLFDDIAQPSAILPTTPPC
ncbi:zinc-dependent peptidase [Chitinibacteraceae bacterium HSL-7]